MSKIKKTLEVVSNLRSLADSIETLCNGISESESLEETNKEQLQTEKPLKNAVSLETVRATLAEKSRMGFTEQIRELLLKYGADRLSKVDPKFYEALLKDVEVLDNAT